MSRPIVPGPTYAEMRNPLLLPAALRAEANAAREDERNPLNLYNINWKNTGNDVERIVLPKELTGVQANIVVLSGRTFPSGSMKVGPAYATLAENEAKIVGELAAAEGHAVDIGGYYDFDQALAGAAMRPSATLPAA